MGLLLNSNITRIDIETETNNEFKYHIYNRQLYVFLKNFSVGSYNKFLPDWVWTLSEKQCRFLLEGLNMSDGDIKEERYNTTSSRLANDVSRLAIHAGFGSYSSFRPKEKHISGRNIVRNHEVKRIKILRLNPHPKVNSEHIEKINRKRTESNKTYQDSLINYEGFVYKLIVPNHVFMIRLNGNHNFIADSSFIMYHLLRLVWSCTLSCVKLLNR